MKHYLKSLRIIGLLLGCISLVFVHVCATDGLIPSIIPDPPSRIVYPTIEPLDRIPEPVFSVAPGFYSSDIQVELFSEVENAVITLHWTYQHQQLNRKSIRSPFS